MAPIAHDVNEDTSPVYEDEVLAAELRAAMKSEGEIELFKQINRMLRVKHELANTETLGTVLAKMWEQVADFFELLAEAPTLAQLPHDHTIVVAHKDMQANFRAVGAINQVFSDAEAAEQQVVAQDQMTREQEDLDDE